MSLLKALAKKARAPVFAAIGENGLTAVDGLALDVRLAFKASPREAGILLVIGEIDAARLGYLERLHDQLPHPRATVFWRTESLARFGNATVVGEGEDAAEVIATVYRRLLAGDMPSEPDLLPDEPPNDWRGKGDHGQGGEGMMGGAPYGRPMAMPDDDIRDGLQLDAFTAEFGPFLPTFPPGLVLKLTLQGDVIQTLTMEHPPFPQSDETSAAGALRRAARLMRLIGQPARAERLQRLAMQIAHGEKPGAADNARALPRWVLASIPAGLGVTVDSGDVRARLTRTLDALHASSADYRQTTIPADARLDRLLAGLEWHEAMLVLASFSVGEIMQLGVNMRSEAAEVTNNAHESHRGHSSHHGHGAHGSHGGHG
ncbi:hypothetical protein ACFOW6_04995 [Fodinicurvata halophila]|uniref:Uncharacterized protein n=2 Tax=Fodinicurvata halophila TaxID=1419723 RepID=A0ABV8UJQ1_9PROT